MKDRIEKELNDYLLLQEYNDQAYSKALPAIVEAVKAEIELEVRNRTALFWEALSYDSWDKKALVDDLWKACYHRDAAAAGQILIDCMEDYLYSYHMEQIEDNWEDYVNG